MEAVEDELAEELKNKCPVNVFDIEDIGKGNSVFVSVLGTSILCLYLNVVDHDDEGCLCQCHWFCINACLSCVAHNMLLLLITYDLKFLFFWYFLNLLIWLLRVGKRRAKVARPRDCTLCRECIRGGKEWEDRVSLRRVKNHFICKYYVNSD